MAKDDKQLPGTTASGSLHYGRRLDDQDLLRYFDESLSKSRQFFDEIREEARLILNMYGGDTLEKEDLAFLATTKRAPVSFNFASATIDTFDGMNPPKDAIFRGQDSGEAEDAKADWLTTLVRQEVMRCNGHDHDSRALRSMLKVGYGFCEHFLDTSRVPIHVVRRYVPFHEVWPDPDAVQTNLNDAKFLIHEREWLLEEVEARWPDKAEELRGSMKGDTANLPDSSTRSIGSRNEGGSSLNSRSRIQIYRLMYNRYVPRVYYIDPETGDEVDATHEEMLDRHEELQKTPGEQGFDPFTGQPVEQPKPFPDGIPATSRHGYVGRSWFQAYISTGAQGTTKAAGGSGVVLSHEELTVPRFPIQALTGFDWELPDEKRVRFFGLGRKIYQPQLYINKSAATFLDILQRGAKGGGFAEKGVAVGSFEKFVEQQSTPGSWTEVEAEAISGNKIQPKPVQAVPAGIQEFLQFCIGTLSDISLISKASMGATDTQTGGAASNVALSNLQEHNQQGLGLLFRANNLFLQEGGLVTGAMVLHHLPAAEIDRMLGQVAPVIGLTAQAGQPDPNNPTAAPPPTPIMIPDPSATPEEGAQPGAPDPQTGQPGPMQRPIRPSDILKATDPFDYDVSVDTGQASPTQKLAAFSLFVVTDLIGTLVKAGYGSIIIPELMKIAPLPGTMGADLANQIQQQIEQQEQGPDPTTLVKQLQGMGPDQIQQLLDKAGIKLPTKQKAPNISIALKGAIQPDPNEVNEIFQAAGIQPTPAGPQQLQGAAAVATTAGAQPPEQQAPAPPLDPNQVLQAVQQAQAAKLQAQQPQPAGPPPGGIPLPGPAQ